jgi:hypothetical protein
MEREKQLRYAIYLSLLVGILSVILVRGFLIYEMIKYPLYIEGLYLIGLFSQVLALSYFFQLNKLKKKALGYKKNI